MSNKPSPHPAKLSGSILRTLDDLLPLEGIGIDPFAGVGRIHELGRKTIGVEIEPEWAIQHPQNIVGNSLHLPFRDRCFQWACTSVSYGNRMSDHHNAKDKHKTCDGQGCVKCWYRGVSLRHTYTHYLGRKLHSDNSGAMPFGPKYWELHEGVYRELDRVLGPNAPFILNVKNFYRKNNLVDVIGWHIQTLKMYDFEVEKIVDVPVPGQRHGANRDLRVDEEAVVVFIR